MTPYERVFAAIEINPDRSRVTIRRDDAREMLDDNQRLTADRERDRVNAIQAETMLTEHCRISDAHKADITYLRNTLEQVTEEREEARKLTDQFGRAILRLTEDRDAAQDELDLARDQTRQVHDSFNKLQATLQKRPTWVDLWLSFGLLPISAFAGFFLHHG
jgi:hypothetical protein